MRPPWRTLLAALLLALSAAGLPAAEDEFEGSDLGRSAIPIVGYDDKTGWIFGGAGFIYSDKEPGINAGLFGVSNLDDFHSLTFNYAQRGLGPWSYDLHLLAERAFDYYYGEGDLTSPRNPLFLRMAHFEVKPTILYRVMPHLRVGAFLDYRARHEYDTQAFPDESSASSGLHGEWDSRDKLINTRSGSFLQLNLSQNAANGGFTQTQVDLRRFIRLGRAWTLASRVEGGTTVGEPSYLFHYSLGGLDLLRGYKNNRFRGVDFFADQEELRWILKRWLSVNASVDWGGIRDQAFHQLKASAQIGLRLGLPPDWGQKLRVDFGVGADQTTFQIQFGEIF